MKPSDYAMAGILVFLAIFIWLRDTAWMTTGDDTLPVLVALPLFVWMGMPWKFDQQRAFDPPVWKILIFAILFPIGIVINSTLLLAVLWTYLLWIWLQQRLEPSAQKSVFRLLVLPLVSFPWISLDADRIGWFFRLTGAYATAAIYQLLGFEVDQQGTNILINDLPISVEAACSGLNTLQSMLIAGTIVNFIILGETQKYWWNFILIVAIAWVANTLRIVGLSAAALMYGSEFALGPFHMWGGWAILLTMFLLCWWLLSLQEPKSQD